MGIFCQQRCSIFIDSDYVNVMIMILSYVLVMKLNIIFSQIFKKYQCLVLASDPNQGKTTKPSGKRRQKSKAKKNTTSTKNPDVDTTTSTATEQQVTVVGLSS